MKTEKLGFKKRLRIFGLLSLSLLAWLIMPITALVWLFTGYNMIDAPLKKAIQLESPSR